MATIVGCGSPSNPNGSGVPSANPAGSATASAGSSNGGAALVGAAALGSVADIATVENHLVDLFAISAGLPTDLHPDTWASVNRTLHDELAKASQNITLTGDAALVASLSNSPPRTAVDGGGAIGLALAAALVLNSSSNSVTGNLNLSLDSTHDATANGERTTSMVSGHIVSTTAGSMVEADVEIGVDVTVADASTGALLRHATFRSRGKITLEFCPDANGKVKGHVTMALDGGTTGAGSASLTVEGTVEGTVGEDAYLQQIDANGTTTQSTTAPGSRGPRKSVISAGFTSAINHAGNMTGTAISHGQVDSGPDDLTDAEATAAYGQIGTATGVAYWLLGDYAQGKWRGGACVRIDATAQSRDVHKNELVQFEARPFHKIELVELHKPIVATFAGKASAEPLDTPVQSPILVSFKAGPKSNDTGNITLTSTSNRGIGTLNIRFRVRGGWIIDASFDRPQASGTIHGQQKCGDPTGQWIATGTYKPKNLQGVFNGTQKWTITINPDAATGTFEYATTAKGQFAGVPVTIYLVGRASGKVTLNIDPISGVAHMVLKETLHTYYSTTKLGGSGTDQNATLETQPMDWDVGGNC
jgi:hypothetical protein